MNYLITGGRGFIGCQVIRQLLAQGHSVLCTAHNLDKTSMHEALTPEEIDKVEIIKADINDTEFMTNLMKERKIEKVIHLAAILGDLAEKDPAEAVRVNILGTISIFNACVAAGVKRCVWASSQSIFGTEEYYKQFYPDKELVPNDVPLHPTLVYGMTKTFNESIAEWYFNNYGLETIGLRYTMVFGIARQRGAGQYATNLINKPAEGEKGVVEWGDTVPNWIYVDDAARATVIASQCPNPKTRNFTIGGERTSIRELRDYVLSILPDAEIELLPGAFPSCYNLDCSAAEEELGYKYAYTTAEGAHETINLIRAKKGLPPV